MRFSAGCRVGERFAGAPAENSLALVARAQMAKTQMDPPSHDNLPSVRLDRHSIAREAIQPLSTDLLVAVAAVIVMAVTKT